MSSSQAKPDSEFRLTVYKLMEQLPRGRVTTYGDIAGLAGHAYAARAVGGIAHCGPIDLPWHRLVNHHGGLARGFPGGPDVQMQLLEKDGITCTDFIVDNFEDLRWHL